LASQGGIEIHHHDRPKRTGLISSESEPIMIEWSDLPTVAIITALILVVCGGVYYAIRLTRPPSDSTYTYEAQVKRDWMTTGRINFAGDWEKISNEHTPHNLFVQVEETRITENIGGGSNIEIRWRSASLGEAKQIVSRYHQFLEEHPDKARTDDPIKVESPAFADDNVRTLVTPAARKLKISDQGGGQQQPG
jgi:hypothetical protein